MSFAPAFRVMGLIAASGVAVWTTGCTTPPPAAPTTARTTSPTTDQPDVLAQARFERLVQRVLEAESDVTVLLDRIQAELDKATQAAVTRSLLEFLNGETFAGILDGRVVLTSDRALQSFTPAHTAALRQHGLDRPIIALVDKLTRIASEVRELAATSEEGRALERIFTLLRREILPTLVETRALVVEEALDANEAAALAQKVEEQLQSINDQLASLKNRARSVATPPP